MRKSIRGERRELRKREKEKEEKEGVEDEDEEAVHTKNGPDTTARKTRETRGATSPRIIGEEDHQGSGRRAKGEGGGGIKKLL